MNPLWRVTMHFEYIEAPGPARPIHHTLRCIVSATTGLEALDKVEAYMLKRFPGSRLRDLPQGQWAFEVNRIEDDLYLVAG